MPMPSPIPVDSTYASDSCMLRPVEADPQPDVLARADSTWVEVPTLEEVARSYGGRVAGEAFPFCFRNGDVVARPLLPLFLVGPFIVS